MADQLTLNLEDFINNILTEDDTSKSPMKFIKSCLPVKKNFPDCSSHYISTYVFCSTCSVRLCVICMHQHPGDHHLDYYDTALERLKQESKLPPECMEDKSEDETSSVNSTGERTMLQEPFAEITEVHSWKNILAATNKSIAATSTRLNSQNQENDDDKCSNDVTLSEKNMLTAISVYHIQPSVMSFIDSFRRNEKEEILRNDLRNPACA